MTELFDASLSEYEQEIAHYLTQNNSFGEIDEVLLILKKYRNTILYESKCYILEQLEKQKRLSHFHDIVAIQAMNAFIANGGQYRNKGEFEELAKNCYDISEAFEKERLNRIK